MSAATFTPGLPPAAAEGAFIGQDAQGSLYLLRWHDTNGWEALGWVGAGKAAMPALRHPAGEDQGLIVGHVRVPGISATIEASQIGPGHVCLHGIRWPWACDDCDRAISLAPAPTPGTAGRCTICSGTGCTDQRFGMGTSPGECPLCSRPTRAPGPAAEQSDAVLRLRQQLERRLQTAVVNADCMGVPIGDLLADAMLAVRYADLAALISGGDQ